MGAGESKQAVTVGLHVLRVAEASPAADAGIEPFFDHLVGYNGTPLVRPRCWPSRRLKTVSRPRTWMPSSMPSTRASGGTSS
jgi:hypothetical protein